MSVLASLKNAGVSAELIAAVAVAIEAARAEGVEIGKEQYKSKNAERQKRFREKGRSVTNNVISNVTSNATNDATKEPSRVRVLCCEESSIITPVIANAITVPKGTDGEKPKRLRGTRMAVGWQPKPETVSAIAAELGIHEADVRRRIPEFIDYWIAIPGAKGSKLDWEATFRNRIRQSQDFVRGKANSTTQLVPGPRSTAPEGKAFVEQDSPAWRAWCAHKGVRSMPSTDHKTPQGIRRGWYMETEWPPEARAGAA